MVGCLCCLRGERKRCRLVIVNWRFPCLRTRFVSTKREIRTGEVVFVVFRTKERQKLCRFVNISQSFSMSSDWIGEHKRQMRPWDVRRWWVFFVVFRAKERGVVSSMLLGDFQ